MKIEIDQSGKIGDTRIATVLAFSDGSSYSIRIKATTKRKLVKELRMFKDSRRFYYQLFAVLVFILIKNFIAQIQLIYIDQEYPGREDEIKAYLIHLITGNGMVFDPQLIHFTRIGKQSAAHVKALESFQKKKAEREIGYDEIISFFVANKKDQGSYL